VKLTTLLLILVALVSTGCSSVKKTVIQMSEKQNVKREFTFKRAWARHTLAKDYLGYRIDHRMPPMLHKNFVIQGNAIDGIRAYHRITGAMQWERRIKGGVEIGAAIAGDRIFFGANDGFFYALNALTGDVEWTFPLKSEGLGRPFVQNDMVYFLTGNSTVYALRASSGEQVWIYNRPETTSLNVRGAAEPVMSGNNILVGFSDGAFLALDKTRGAIVWEKQLGVAPRFKDIDSKAVVDGDKLYVSSYDGQLFCLGTSDGRTIWSYEEGGYSPVTIEGDLLFYASSTGSVIALDKNSGQQRWKKTVEKSIATQPVFYRGLIIYGEWTGQIKAVEATTGQDVAAYATGRGVAAVPVIDAKSSLAYFTTVDANLFVLRLGWNRPTEVWEWEK
jgi:outer membrane protein assembly factor BamB